MYAERAKRERLVAALVSAAWLDSEPVPRVHDWWDYAGRYIGGKFSKSKAVAKSIQKQYEHPGERDLANALEGKVAGRLQPSGNLLESSGNQPEEGVLKVTGTSTLTSTGTELQAELLPGASAGNEEKAKTPDPENPKAPKRELTDLWMDAYKAKHGRKYLFVGDKDGSAADRLLTLGLPPVEIIAIAKQAWEHPTWFNCKHAADLAQFAGRFNAICQELKHCDAA